MKKLLSTLIDYAFFEKFEEHPIKSFLLSVLFNWGIAAIASIVIIGPLVLITGGNFIKYVLYFCIMFAGGQLVYPFVATLMRGHEDATGFSYGFYYGTFGLTVLFHKMKFIKQLGSLTKENHQLWDEHLFFSAYAVILPNDGTGIFHKHGCSMLSTSSGFWIYKTGSAFSKGYDPCVYCMQSGYYIGNINSGVYHRPTCGTLPDLWNRTYFYTKAEAQNAGYRACGNCHP